MDTRDIAVSIFGTYNVERGASVKESLNAVLGKRIAHRIRLAPHWGIDQIRKKKPIRDKAGFRTTVSEWRIRQAVEPSPPDVEAA